MKEADEKAAAAIGVAVIVLVIGLVVLLIGCICANYAGLKCGQQAIRTEAVERGFAEWVPDKEGNVSFKWKEARNDRH